MRNLLLLFISISILSSCQNIEPPNKDNSDINLIGIWVLTDYNNPNKFQDYWEFKSNKVFNELKFKSDGDVELFPDESGTWDFKGNNLKINVTHEDFKGEQIMFEEIQEMEFLIEKDKNGFILYFQSDSNNSKDKNFKLRLSKKG